MHNKSRNMCLLFAHGELRFEGRARRVLVARKEGLVTRGEACLRLPGVNSCLPCTSISMS
eukprot:6191194-Pleurochrysis_carterae.AAC.6